MWDLSFYHDSALLESQLRHPRRSRHGILLAHYEARRRERLALEQIAGRAANRAAWRKLAAALTALAARVAVRPLRARPAGSGIPESGTERRPGLPAAE